VSFGFPTTPGQRVISSAGQFRREIQIPRHRVSVTFSLSARQVKLLDQLAERTNVPKSVYVRKGVDFILRKYRELLQRTAPQSRRENESR